MRFSSYVLSFCCKNKESLSKFLLFTAVAFCTGSRKMTVLEYHGTEVLPMIGYAFKVGAMGSIGLELKFGLGFEE